MHRDTRALLAIILLGGALTAGLMARTAHGENRRASAPVPEEAAGLPQFVPEPAALALQRIGWKPEDLRLDRPDMDLYGGGLYRLPLFDDWIDRPFAIPGDVDLFRKALVAGADKPSDLSVFAGVRLGRGVRRGLITDPAKAIEDSLPVVAPLSHALARVEEVAARGHPGAAHRKTPAQSRFANRWRRHPERATSGQLRTIPASWQRPLALVLEAEAEAAEWRRMAMAPVAGANAVAGVGNSPVDPLRWLEHSSIRYVLGLDSDAQDPAFLRAVENAAASVDLPLLQAGTTDLLLALERAIPQFEDAARRDAPGQAIRLSTPLGIIAVGTAAADRYPAGDYLLILDPGGPDLYEGGATGTSASPVSVLLDLAGDDRYVSGDSTRPSFGAGVTGIGILIDRSGDDQYRGVNLSEGAGLCGAGFLWDCGGDDRYDAYTAAQGAGLFGIGILADRTGADRYHAFQQVQGYGYTLGCGLLVDAEGDDSYLADDTVIRFPSAQSREHNSSLAQGFGFGKRADYLDGHSLAGGIGFLVDGAGDDEYRCGVFGQGAGYWYGIGVLADGSGKDRYEGIWYVQGSAAHFAIGHLWDGAGADSYRATMNMAQGAGHDFSLGLLYDRAGDDLYLAPNLSLGGGNANGFGIFWDKTGSDTYQVEGTTSLGRSNVASRGGLRDRMKNLGLFLDTGGLDSYPASKPFAGNGQSWIQTGTNQEDPLPTEIGVGLDIDPESADR